MNSDYVTWTRKRIDRFGDDYHYNNDDEYKNVFQEGNRQNAIHDAQFYFKKIMKELYS